MPNHVQNKLTIIGDTQRVKEVFRSIKGSPYDDGTPKKIDFNAIIPMPEGLNIDSDSWVSAIESRYDNQTLNEHLEKLRKRASEIPQKREEVVNNFIQGVRNYLEHGFATWYSWCIENWGTKWNAYTQNDKRDTENTIFFQTAWNAPIKVIRKLSEMFPDLVIDFCYADEDSGCNTGKISFMAGKQIYPVIPVNQSKPAYDIYFDLHPNEIEKYKLIEGKYIYISED